MIPFVRKTPQAAQACETVGHNTHPSGLLSGIASLAFVPRQYCLYRAFRLTVYAARMDFPNCKALLLAVAFAFSVGSARGQNADPASAASLNESQIVWQMQQHNQQQTNELKGYRAVRHYQVEYRGFSAKLGAKMEVEVNFDASSGKKLRIVSQSGSGALCDKVLKRAVETERDAGKDKSATALTEDNYRFKLLGTEDVSGRSAYILDVEPLTSSTFLYRGRIWVDSTDFAVVKMETEPAKSPSFWISKTLIHFTSAKTGGFWLPQQIRSETNVRIGGTATLTIDYGNYQIEPELAIR